MEEVLVETKELNWRWLIDFLKIMFLLPIAIGACALLVCLLKLQSAAKHLLSSFFGISAENLETTK